MKTMERIRFGMNAFLFAKVERVVPVNSFVLFLGVQVQSTVFLPVIAQCGNSFQDVSRQSRNS